MALRICRRCKIEANSENDLNLFVISKDMKYQRDNYCKKCFNETYNKKWSIINNPIYNPITNLRNITYKGKQMYLKNLKRTNICSLCGKTSEEQGGIQMSIHHIIYDDKNPLANTLELCMKCHQKVHHNI